MDTAASAWPDLPYHKWQETAATLQLWTQIVGKIRLALTAWVNHGWAGGARADHLHDPGWR